MNQFAITTQTAVVMVIHQPNKKCFDIVDDVVLLQASEEGGRVAYCGPVYPGHSTSTRSVKEDSTS